MKIAKTEHAESEDSLNTSYDAVESAIDLAKKAVGNWESLARQGRIKRWKFGVGSPQNEKDPPSSPERP